MQFPPRMNNRKALTVLMSQVTKYRNRRRENRSSQAWAWRAASLPRVRGGRGSGSLLTHSPRKGVETACRATKCISVVLESSIWVFFSKQT